MRKKRGSESSRAAILKEDHKEHQDKCQRIIQISPPQPSLMMR